MQDQDQLTKISKLTFLFYEILNFCRFLGAAV